MLVPILYRPQQDMHRECDGRGNQDLSSDYHGEPNPGEEDLTTATEVRANLSTK